MKRKPNVNNVFKPPEEVPDFVKFQAVRQLNQELLDRLKKAHEDIATLKLSIDKTNSEVAVMLKNAYQEIARLSFLLQSNGKEEVLSQSVGNPEERTREEQAVPEVEEAGKAEEIKENTREFGC
jgi:hypothetical protein